MKDTAAVRDKHLGYAKANKLTRLWIESSCRQIQKLLETSYALPEGSSDLPHRWKAGICG